MTDPERSRSVSSLVFLLSVQTLPMVGCAIPPRDDDDDGGGQGSSTTSPGQTSTTDPATSVDGTATAPGHTTTSAGPLATGATTESDTGGKSVGDVTTTFSSTVGDTDTDVESDTEIEVPDACSDIVRIQLECIGASQNDAEYEAALCAYAFEYYYEPIGPECASS